ncbi:MAG: glycosyl hydrolase 2 galactose-binding domain-containing protein [Bryobacteraceae bacterium]
MPPAASDISAFGGTGFSLWGTIILISLFILSASGNTASGAETILLRHGWWLASSAALPGHSGEAFSSATFERQGWQPVTLPSTVLSALAAAGVYPDPYFGLNLRSIPGSGYPIGANFSNLPMPPDSPFRASWWYRTRFSLPAAFRGKTVWLGFDGINFRANVWLNGKPVAASGSMAGAWRLFRFDVTGAAIPGADNVLAVEIFPPEPHDLAITFVDWNPLPPDKDMGLWRDVWIAATGPVAIRFPMVATRLDSPAGESAQVTLSVELTNASARPVAGSLRGKIVLPGKPAVVFSRQIDLGPHESRTARFTPSQFPQLRLVHPRLWWPLEYGKPELYPLDLEFVAAGKVSDSSHTGFGVREVTGELDAAGHRLFRVNGRKILIRGAGYSFDMLLRSSPQRQRAELDYVQDMHLNAIRFEGKLEDDAFLDECDRRGILVLAGWCCCDHWEKWRDWNAEDEDIAAASLRDQLRRLARHPAVFDWMYGSDGPPPPPIENLYLAILKETGWPNPYQSSASARETPAGATGVKMTGPYEYVAPSYWYLDTERGGAFGFNTETSPGPAPPPVESLRRMLPAGDLWPIDSVWNFHAGGGHFKNLEVFNQALERRYGKPASLEDYARKAQMMAYEGHRAMFEAYIRNKYASTGVIQWMLNNAWPGMIWHLYDWYLRPGGSYFGVKKANEPLHIQYSYDDRSVVVANAGSGAAPGLKASARVYDFDMSRKFTREVAFNAPPDSSTRVFQLPEPAGLSRTYFVALELAGASGVASRNFYWLSTAPETLDWSKSTGFVTPTRTFADYTALNRLPEAALELRAETRAAGDSRITTVHLRNPSRALAFGLLLKLDDANGEEILPVLWEDNYVALLPGETRTLTARWRGSEARPTVEAQAWNTRAVRVPATPR